MQVPYSLDLEVELACVWAAGCGVRKLKPARRIFRIECLGGELVRCVGMSRKVWEHDDEDEDHENDDQDATLKRSVQVSSPG